MAVDSSLTRRGFLQTATLALAGAAASKPLRAKSSPQAAASPAFLREIPYGDITLVSEPHQRQLRQNLSLLMSLNEDSLLKPLRAMSDQPAPGTTLGGWYEYDPGYNHKDIGFAPSHCFGQWVSALARMYAIDGQPEVRSKVLRLNGLYAQTISGLYYERNRFPAYCYDKLVCGLMDSHVLANDPDAWRILAKTTDTALPHLPPHAVQRGVVWRPGKDVSWTWDESYTLPENLFLASTRGAGGDRYRALAFRYLEDRTYFDPLAEGKDVLAGRHAYSYVNALCSAMQAYMVGGSQKHLRAAQNAFVLIQAQSFASGGWGPDEELRAAGSDDVYRSLSTTHHSFETPCGSYAHMKLTRYLLRVTRDGRYGDSMERVMYNTVLGAKPLEPDGHAFYYSDYNYSGAKVYSDHRWPCCGGTLPQVAADYRINSYLRDDDGIYVVLYLPSSVSWTQEGAQVTLAQRSAYPLEDRIQFEFSASRPETFSIRLRIPAWAPDAVVLVNGKQIQGAPVTAGFLSLHRRWDPGDRIELQLPLALRTEAINVRHPETVALLRGPLVLFATPDAGTGETPSITRAQLLAARRRGPDLWHAPTARGPLRLVPFTAIGSEPYSTYIRIT
jgi:hypothetical protein